MNNPDMDFAKSLRRHVRPYGLQSPHSTSQEIAPFRGLESKRKAREEEIARPEGTICEAF